MLKVEKDVFYFLDGVGEKWVFATEEDAVKKLKEKLKEIARENTVKNPEELQILEVDVSEDKWNIKQLSWSKIAMKLLVSGE